MYVRVLGFVLNVCVVMRDDGYSLGGVSVHSGIGAVFNVKRGWSSDMVLEKRGFAAFCAGLAEGSTCLDDLLKEESKKSTLGRILHWNCSTADVHVRG